MKRLIRAFNLPVLELDGYEADDIIGTLAREACAPDFVTYMVTPDKDFGQLVNECVQIYRPGRMGDGAEILGVPEVLAKWGIKRCDQVRDILGFWATPRTTFPAFPASAPKTAQKLIAQYDTLENALDHVAEQKGKLKESLEKFRDQALLSKRLATIDVNVPIPFEPEKLRIGPRDEPTLRRSSPNSNSTPSAAASSATISRRARRRVVRGSRRCPSGGRAQKPRRAVNRARRRDSGGYRGACRNIRRSRPSPSRCAPSRT